VWGSTDQQFGKDRSILPDAVKQTVPEVASDDPDENFASAISIGAAEKQETPSTMIDEATDLLATVEGGEAVEQAKIAAERNRRMSTETD
jgi:hypothetical protein